MLVDEMLRVMVGGGAVSDADVRAAAFGIENYSITVGDGSQSWHTCTQEQYPAFVDAIVALRARSQALQGPAPSPADPRIAELMFAIAGYEEQAQNAEDREQHGKASKARAKATALKAELATLRGG